MLWLLLSSLSTESIVTITLFHLPYKCMGKAQAKQKYIKKFGHAPNYIEDERDQIEKDLCLMVKECKQNPKLTKFLNSNGDFILEGEGSISTTDRYADYNALYIYKNRVCVIADSSCIDTDFSGLPQKDKLNIFNYIKNIYDNNKIS